MKLNDFGEVIENASLKNYNTYGIETSCKYLVKVDNIDSLLKLMKYLKEDDIKYYVLGKGSNVILPDSNFQGVIISLEKLNKVEINGLVVEAESGVILNKLINMTVNESLSGLEYLAGIPGTLGGALFGNAGVKEHTIYDNLKSIKIIREGKLLEINKENIDIDYRYTEFKAKKDIIVSAVFCLNKGDIENMQELIKNNLQKRNLTQPLEYRNAGSVFKNPQGMYAGKLIEAVGLKGYKIGDAEVSNKHANFIINKGNASSRDIKKLIELIKKKVYDIYKINLELEQIIIDWD